MAVDIQLAVSPTLGTARKLFTRPPLTGRGVTGWSAKFDVSRDGSTFVFATDVPSTSVTSALMLDQNWFAEFAKHP